MSVMVADVGNISLVVYRMGDAEVDLEVNPVVEVDLVAEVGKLEDLVVRALVWANFLNLRLVVGPFMGGVAVLIPKKPGKCWDRG